MSLTSVSETAWYMTYGPTAIQRIVSFWKYFKNHKSITEEETEITYEYVACNYPLGYWSDRSMFECVDPHTGKLGYGMYREMSFLGHTFTVNGKNVYKDGELMATLSYTYCGICMSKESEGHYYLGYVTTSAGAIGSSGTAGWFKDYPCDTVVKNTQKASIDLDTWNTNIDWLDDLVESGDDTYVSVDSDSYSEVSDPEELADTILDGIADNTYEGSLAETPEPVNYATTVKAALDDIYDQYESTMRWISVPSTASSTGIKGQMAKDSSYLYICVATNTWCRMALESIT